MMVAEGEGCCNCRQQSKAWLGWGWGGWLCEVHVPKPPVFAVVATLWTKAWLRRTTCLTLPWRCEHVATCSGRRFFPGAAIHRMVAFEIICGLPFFFSPHFALKHRCN